MVRQPAVLCARSGGHPPVIFRRAYPDGWLAVVSRGGGTLIALDNAVLESQVAAVVRHLETQHAGSGVACCRLPECDAVLAWRPAGTADAVAASAGRASTA